VDILNPKESETIYDPACGAPRGAIKQYLKGKETIRMDSSMPQYCWGLSGRHGTTSQNMSEARRTRGKGRNSITIPRPQAWVKARLRKKSLSEAPRGSTSWKQWRWDGSHRLTVMSHGTLWKACLLEVNRQWLKRYKASGRWRRCQETSDGRTGET